MPPVSGAFRPDWAKLSLTESVVHKIKTLRARKKPKAKGEILASFLVWERTEEGERGIERAPSLHSVSCQIHNGADGKKATHRPERRPQQQRPNSNAAGEHCTGRREVTGTYQNWGDAYV